MPQTIEQRKTAYAGAAGELRAASELSLRGYIVHMPVVDEGGDLFAIAEDAGRSYRIQVKTAIAVNRQRSPGNTCLQVNFKERSLRGDAEIFFVLYFIFNKSWNSIVIDRESLWARSGSKVNNPSQRTIQFYFNESGVFANLVSPERSLKKYVDGWDNYFPVIPATGALW